MIGMTLGMVKRWMYEFEVPLNRNKVTVDLYSKLINEELKELEDEFAETATPNELKECLDLLWVTLGKIYALGYSTNELEDGLQQLYRSNMSKLCSTEEEAIDYANKFPNTSYKRTRNGHYMVFNTETNKILKGPNYESPKFDGSKS